LALDPEEGFGCEGCLEGIVKAGGSGGIGREEGESLAVVKGKRIFEMFVVGGAEAVETVMHVGRDRLAGGQGGHIVTSRVKKPGTFEEDVDGSGPGLAGWGGKGETGEAMGGGE